MKLLSIGIKYTQKELTYKRIPNFQLLKGTRLDSQDEQTEIQNVQESW
jgi:hypothetical protein